MLSTWKVMMSSPILTLTSVTPRQPLLALMVLVLVVSGGMMLLLYPLYVAHRHYDEAIEQLSDRSQRYVRLSRDADMIAADLQRLQSRLAGTMPEYATPSLAASAIQAKLARLVKGLKGEVSSTAMLPVVEEEGFRRITVHVEVVVSIDVLQRVLYALESQKPYLMIRNIDITLQRARRNRSRVQQVQEQRLKVGFDMVGYAPIYPS
ncbi:MAG: type II secretion system protein GspM [Mariprofundaceae bacterium]